MNQPALAVHDLAVHYGISQVLFGVDLTIEKGQCVALLGRNGAGKSTTMKAISGIHPSTSGRIVFNGRSIFRDKAYRIARSGLAFVPEDRQTFPDHTVEENLLIAAKPDGSGTYQWNLDNIYKTFPLLVPLRHRQGGLLSGGEQQLLVIARALMGNPSLLLLDEPSEGLAPVVVQQIARCVAGLRKAGTTILLAEQNMHFCLHIATHVAVIDKGHIVYSGTIEELRGNDDIKRRYLSV
ncbi:MAG: ABC transporter ATP-binding protein [Candidimonas sp.]|nr:MAG: ABC transporter ATP-binding protein [Candidimonas sp.]TAM22196.1 MAG: ABC transporter ATP-binding protein [Candidimonas sp.]